jgi:hypothetical protein
MGDSNIDGDGGEVDGDGGGGDGVDGDGSGGFPISVGCRNRDLCPPKLVFDGGSAVELYLGKHRLI